MSNLITPRAIKKEKKFLEYLDKKIEDFEIALGQPAAACVLSDEEFRKQKDHANAILSELEDVRIHYIQTHLFKEKDAGSTSEA